MEEQAKKNSEEKVPKKAGTSKAKKKAASKKRGQIAHGRAYIQATYNNTIVTLTDLNGNVLGWSSSGASGFTGPKKSTPFAATMVIKNALEKVADYGLKEVNIFVTGVGQGKEAAIRAFNANGVNILSIKDITPIPHNGCRSPRPRRV
ncbi:MAG: 30S ribosomal protein S11 [Patescibacteria group bacterium]